ncbi:MAG: S1/P1 nuclease [Terriglobales bacterium]
MRSRVHSLVLAFVLLPFACTPAWAWGCRGHEIIALIAAAHLQPAVAARVRQILEVPVGPAPLHPCRGAAHLPSMARFAGWADAVRTPATEAFHFVDLPLDDRRNQARYASICQSQCLSAALNRYMRQLHAGSTTARDRAIALRYVIHLVGDAFQPLHVSDHGDRGGNCVRTRLPGARRRSELHADWDSGILNRMMGTGDVEEYAEHLDRHFGGRYASGSLHPLDWIWSSHAVAVRTAYGPLHLAPGCHERTIRLSRSYVRTAEAAIRRQLDRAGSRLAAVLNQELSRP